jgi:pyridoxamine 5'-phosphate oxidase-like protein
MSTNVIQRKPPAAASAKASPSRLDSEQVWRALNKASFAVLSFVTPNDEPRSSGVVYAVEGGHLYTAVAPDSWKARCIADGKQVSVTVPVRRGGVLSLLVPIPPATISFHARAIVHPAGSFAIGTLSKKLAALVPEKRRAGSLLELVPEGVFLTYGIGVSLMAMTDPDVALARVPSA